MSSIKFYSIIALFCCVQTISTIFVSVYNKTTNDIYVGIYYGMASAKVIARRDPVLFIPAHQTRVLSHNSINTALIPFLVTAASRDVLASQIILSQERLIGMSFLDTSVSTDYYIVEEHGRLIVYDADTWQTIKNVRVIAEPKRLGGLRNKIQKDFIAFKQNKYKHTVAQVDVGDTISYAERVGLQKRLDYVQQAITTVIDEPGPYVPKIALVTSGGGMRAMMYTAGFLVGAEKYGLDKLITWWSTCSGSGWFAAPYFMMRRAYEDAFEQPLTFEQCRAMLIEYCADKKIKEVVAGEKRLIANALAVEKASGQPLTLVNMWGGLLGNRLFQFFGDDRHRQYLSSLTDLVNKGQLILPYFTAVDADTESIWYEFSPWQVGTAWDQHYIPTWSLGRSFNQGSSTNFSPENNIGYILGVSSSAFAAQIRAIYEKLTSDKKFAEASGIKGYVHRMMMGSLGQKRITYAELPNYTYGMPSAQPFSVQRAGHALSMRHMRYRRLIDAGIAANLPYAPVSGVRKGREADIIIFVDASQWVVAAQKTSKIHSLRGAEQFARKHGLKFPVIDYTNVGKEPISVFRDMSDDAVPIVIYVPRINPQQFWPHLHDAQYMHYKKYVYGFDLEQCVQDKTNFCFTTNSRYTKNQAYQLSYTAEFVMHMIKDTILDVIKSVTLRKQSEKKAFYE